MMIQVLSLCLHRLNGRCKANMPFKNSRIFLIGGVIVFFVVVALVAASSSPRTPQSGVAGKICTVTVNADIGIQSIQITNQNSPSGKPWTILPMQLPYSFNCTSGDTLSFNATAKESFLFNYWFPDSGMPFSSNPYTVKVQQPITLTAQFKPEMAP